MKQESVSTKLRHNIQQGFSLKLLKDSASVHMCGEGVIIVVEWIGSLLPREPSIIIY